MLSDQAIKLLTAARQRITDPKHWTTRASARSSAGVRTSPGSLIATCWCASGALIVEMHVVDPGADAGDRFAHMAKISDVAIGTLSRSMSYSNIAFFNDTHTHEEVLAAFDRAIILAQEV